MAANQHQHANTNASRSPSPGRRCGGGGGGASSLSAESNDSSLHSLESTNGRRKNTNENLSSPSSQASLTASTPVSEQTLLLPLNRSASQESQAKSPVQSASSSSLANVGCAALPKSESKPKKKPWYNALYPTYKSKSEDFKRIFKDIPDEERLIVDYSCAVQRDILIHGRLYVSQKYLCFYANIFGWETLFTLQWKDVSAITKEKTALVIPNAILVCTEKEKHFFTSFSGRDKAYMMLFTIWQNALLDKCISSQEMWQLVHSSYGERLGYDSDDEDNPQYLLDDDKSPAVHVVVESAGDTKLMDGASAEEASGISVTSRTNSVPASKSRWARGINNYNEGDTLPTDMSDTSDSELDKAANKDNHEARCIDPHEGRKLLSEEFPFHVDQLFTMLFTNSKFYLELLTSRKTTDLVQASWEHDTESGLKCRKVSFTLVLGQAVGPKSAAVTESQVMLPCTKPGYVYSIEVTSCNAGIPYADSFTVVVHYCLQKVSEGVTLFEVYGQVKYKKSVWGFVKSIIEKNCWTGLEEYFDHLSKALHAEIEDERGPQKRKSRRRRRVASAQRESETGSLPPSPSHRSPQTRKSLTGSPLREKLPQSAAAAPSIYPLWMLMGVLCVLAVINMALYWRLWGLEGGTHGFFGHIVDSLPGSSIVNPGKTPPPDLIAEWSKVLRDQSLFQIEELDKWRKALNEAIVLLKQTESALANLQMIVKPAVEGNPKMANSEL